MNKCVHSSIFVLLQFKYDFISSPILRLNSWLLRTFFPGHHSSHVYNEVLLCKMTMWYLNWLKPDLTSTGYGSVQPNCSLTYWGSQAEVSPSMFLVLHDISNIISGRTEHKITRTLLRWTEFEMRIEHVIPKHSLFTKNSFKLNQFNFHERSLPDTLWERFVEAWEKGSNCQSSWLPPDEVSTNC